MPALIAAGNVLCAGGRGAAQLWSTVRSGVACTHNSFVADRHFDPIQMGLVPEEELEPLPAPLESSVLPASAKRMLQLAGPTLAAIADAAGDAPLTLFVGLPRLAAAENPWLPGFLRYLSKFEGVKINQETSRIFPQGRAATLVALEAALQHLAQDPNGAVVVGGVDSFLDMRRLSELDMEERILGPRVMDGFIPGEGAGFFVLKGDAASRPGPAAGAVRLLGAATTEDPGHRYGSAPGLCEGLADAVDKLRAVLPQGTAPIASTFAGFNGENFEAKLWGVARLRHSDFIAPEMLMHHPADCIGDTGAAAGAILTVLAAHALTQGHRPNSALVWAASDHESRGCALLST